MLIKISILYQCSLLPSCTLLSNRQLSKFNYLPTKSDRFSSQIGILLWLRYLSMLNLIKIKIIDLKLTFMFVHLNGIMDYICNLFSKETVHMTEVLPALKMIKLGIFFITNTLTSLNRTVLKHLLYWESTLKFLQLDL